MEKYFEPDFANEHSTVTILTLAQRMGLDPSPPIVAPFNESKHLIITNSDYKLIENDENHDKQLSTLVTGFRRNGEFFYHYSKPKQQPKIQ